MADIKAGAKLRDTYNNNRSACDYEYYAKCV